MHWTAFAFRRIRTTAMLVSLAASLALLVAWTAPAQASHFRYGHLTWQPLGGNTARFTLVNGFRRDGYFGSAGDGFPAIGDVITETVGGTFFAFGDGSFTGTLLYKVNSIDPLNNWLLAEALEPGSSTKTTIDHTYSAPTNFGAPWTAEINSCCRTFNEINNPSEGYRVLTEVNFSIPGRSPASSLPAIINLTCNTAGASFVVPGVDPDPNTRLMFRLATPGEASQNIQFHPFQQPGPPNATFPLSIDPNTGIANWNTFGATCNGLYSCQVVIEDLDAVTSVKRGQVAVDFLINLVDCDSTNQAPSFTPPSPPCGSTISGHPGAPLSFTMCASDANPGAIQLNHTGLPAGASLSTPLPAFGNPICTTLDWTPTTSDTGLHLVTFSATDSCGQQAQCTVTIDVVTNQDPSCGDAVASPAMLWPPNHSYVPISISGVTDPDGDPITVTVIGITQDEPINTRGDGNTCPDGQIVDGQASVRAERTGTPGIPGNGRVYGIIFTASDGKGGSCTDTAYVCVPHDQGDPTCVDDGQRYGSLDACSGGSQLTQEITEVSLAVAQVTATQVTLEFALPQDLPVDMSVFDLAGRRVATVEKGMLTTGVYQRTWDMRSAAQGMYFVRLRAGRVSLTRTVMKVR